MDVTPTERGKAEATLRRLEGAKRETGTAVAPAPAPTMSATTSTTTPAPTDTSATPSPTPEASHNGRIDGATIAAGAVGVVGLGVGTIFGVVALSKHPSNFATGSGHSYDDYLNAKSAASTDATISTVGFAVGVVGIAAAAVLYFVRPAKNPNDAAVAVGIGRQGALVGGSF
jgi:serine/threonine-protein kinase